MNKSIFFWVTLFLFADIAAYAQMPFTNAPERYSYVRISFTSIDDMQRLQELGLALDHVHGKRGVFVETFLQPDEIARVANAGFAHEILIADWYQHYDARPRGTAAERRALLAKSTVKGFELGSMGGFYTLQEAVAELDSMRLLYPHLISARTSLGKSIENRDLWMVKISSSPDAPRPLPEVLYTGLLHAREPISMMALMYFMYYVLENYGVDPEVTYLLDHRELYFVPVANPDGYVYNQTMHPNGGGLWRKNRRWILSNVYGVDLNRNFGYRWGFDDVGSNGNPGSEAYRGAGPFSEPETAALRDFCLGRNFKAALNYHSYGGLLIHPFGYDDSEPPDSLIYRDLGRELTRENGYTYGTGMFTIGGVANGVAEDWMYGEQTAKPAALAFTQEVGTFADEFWPAPSRIIPLAQENLSANLSLAWVAGAYVLPTAFELSREFPQAGDQLSLRLKLRNKGVSETASQLAVEVVSQSPHLEMLAGNLALADLAAQSEVLTPENALRFAVHPGYREGEYATLEVRVHQNGAVVSTPFTFQLGAGRELLADGAEIANNTWRLSGGWGRDSSFAHQGKFSFKDNPHANSGNLANTEMTLAAPLDLTDIASARLEFYTQHAIESEWDFGQVLASVDGGRTWEALRGKLMGFGNGTNYQPLFQPGYDGLLRNWEKEEINLDGFIGEGDSLLLKFQFRSDESITFRGWYVDNIRVISYPKTPVAVAETNPASKPSVYKLGQNYPNPFNPLTTIEYALPKSLHVSLKVFNLLGEEIATLVNATQLAGEHKIAWNPGHLPSGVYVYRLLAGEFSAVRKLVLLR